MCAICAARRRLAVELYLKCFLAETRLHQLEGCLELKQITAHPPKTHALQRLFDMIEGSLRTEIEAAYNLEKPIPHVPLLRDALGRYDQLFVEIRYLFERQEAGNLQMGSLMALVGFFRRLIPTMGMHYSN